MVGDGRVLQTSPHKGFDVMTGNERRFRPTDIECVMWPAAEGWAGLYPPITLFDAGGSSAFAVPPDIVMAQRLAEHGCNTVHDIVRAYLRTFDSLGGAEWAEEVYEEA